MNSKLIVFLITGLILGFLITRQFSIRSALDQATDPKTTSAIAVEVAENIKTNKKLRDEFAALEDQQKNLAQSSDSTQQTDSFLQKELTQLAIVAGDKDITGHGVDIDFDQSLVLTQLVDLVNALRNIGAEAISVNDQRIVLGTPLINNMTVAPISIKAIGDSKILSDSLKRQGGIMDQIGSSGKVAENNNINIPAARK